MTAEKQRKPIFNRDEQKIQKTANTNLKLSHKIEMGFLNTTIYSNTKI